MKLVDEAEWRIERVGRARVLARHGALETVRDALESDGSLFAWAAAQPSARRLEGRGAAYRVRLSGGDWLVRHYRRGGAVAVHLGDRYARLGVPRPFRELAASGAARARGVPTPAVVAAAVYPAGAFYRGDIAVAFIPRSRTLADALFAGAGDADAVAGAHDGGLAAARAAGAAIRQGHDRGLVHPDLNIRNLLLAETGAGLRGYILDLDGARVVAEVSGGARRRMVRRFWRSVGKWEAKTGRPVSTKIRDAFETGYETGRAHD
ncbi:MAG: lipopolysaccharide kinase InaA family protein [Gemmatimonadota bacterium]